jgi:hypothetical protein
VKKADGEHLRFSDIDMKITIGGYHVRLDNLFNGDKFLGNILLAGLCMLLSPWGLVLQKLITALWSHWFNPR